MWPQRDSEMIFGRETHQKSIAHCRTRLFRILFAQKVSHLQWLQLCANRFAFYGHKNVPIDLSFSLFNWHAHFARRIQSCRVYTYLLIYFMHSRIILMPKKRLFNLKNLGSWAGIKKRKSNNGKAQALNKENVCHSSYSLNQLLFAFAVMNIGTSGGCSCRWGPAIKSH